MRRSRRIILFTFFILGFCHAVVFAKGEAINPAQGVSNQKDGWNPQIIRRSSPQPLKVFVLDVGQGDSIFIEFPYGETILVDCGSYDDYGIPHVKSFLRDYFKANKYKNNTVDVVVASHPDADHIRGLKDLLASYNINWYIDNGLPGTTRMYKALMSAVNEYDKKDKLDYIAVKEDNPEFEDKGFLLFNNIVHFKDVDVYVLGSYKGSGKEDVNNASVVLKIVYGKTSILLTGDSEGKNELDKNKYITVNLKDYEENRIYRRLQDKNRLSMLDSDVLKVGHHGSHHSATELYLAEVTPRISLISVGDYRISSHAVRFGHPRLETLERLDKYTVGKGEEQYIKAYKDKGLKNDFTTEKAIYLTSKEHELGGGTVDKFGDIIIMFDGEKVSKGDRSD